VGSERNSHVREKGRSCSNEGGRRRVGGCEESHGFRMGGDTLTLFVLHTSPPTLHTQPSLPHDLPFPLHGQVPLLVVPQSLRPKTCRLPKTSLADVKHLLPRRSPLLQVGHVAHAPSQVEPRSGSHHYWEGILLFIGSFGSPFVRLSIPFAFDYPFPLHSFLFDYSLLPLNIAAPPSLRRLRARCRASYYDSVKFLHF